MLNKLFWQRKDQWIAFILFCVLIITLIPLFLISKYAVPSSDDYAYALFAGYSHGEYYNLFQVTINCIKGAYDEWLKWQGLYFSNFLSYFINYYCMREYYFLTTFLSLGIFVVSELISGYLILKQLLNTTTSLAFIFTIPLIIVQVLIIPCPVEAFFWMCGSIIYTTMLSLAILYLSLWAFLAYKPNLSRFTEKMLKIFLSFGTICIGGSNYLVTMFVLGISTCLLACSIWKKRQHISFFIGNYILFLACTALVIFSPGSSNRLTTVAAGMPAIKAIFRSFVEAFTYIKQWTSIPIIILLIGLIPVVWKIVGSKKINYPMPLLFTLISYCLYSMLFTPNLYAIGSLGAYRSINIYRMSLYALLFINMLYWVGFMRRILSSTSLLKHHKMRIHPFFSFLYCGVLGISVSFLIYFFVGPTTSSLSAYYSLKSGYAKLYHDTYIERLVPLENELQKNVELQPYEYPPYVLFFEDFKSDPNAWQNVTLALYYHKDSIIVDTSE